MSQVVRHSHWRLPFYCVALCALAASSALASSGDHQLHNRHRHRGDAGRGRAPGALLGRVREAAAAAMQGGASVSSDLRGAPRRRPILLATRRRPRCASPPTRAAECGALGTPSRARLAPAGSRAAAWVGDPVVRAMLFSLYVTGIALRRSTGERPAPALRHRPLTRLPAEAQGRF